MRYAGPTGYSARAAVGEGVWVLGEWLGVVGSGWEWLGVVGSGWEGLGVVESGVNVEKDLESHAMSVSHLQRHLCVMVVNGHLFDGHLHRLSVFQLVIGEPDDPMRAAPELPFLALDHREAVEVQ